MLQCCRQTPASADQGLWPSRLAERGDTAEASACMSCWPHCTHIDPTFALMLMIMIMITKAVIVMTGIAFMVIIMLMLSVTYMQGRPYSGLWF